jgi:hypothetical protein
MLNAIYQSLNPVEFLPIETAVASGIIGQWAKYVKRQ